MTNPAGTPVCPRCGLKTSTRFVTNDPEATEAVREKLVEWGFCGGHDDDPAE